MKVAYLHDENLNASVGVARKIRAQLREWERHDIRGAVVGLRDDVRVEIPPWGLGKLRSHWANAVAMGERLRALEPDLVYMRYIKWAPGLVESLGDVPVVLEVNTDDRNEYFAAGMHHGVYNALTRRTLLERVDAFVAVTPELLSHRVIGAAKKPCVVIPNGYDFARVQLSGAERSARRGHPPNCVFVGTDGHTWHGIDRLLELARLLPEWKFNIVGISRERLGTNADVSSNVAFLGVMSGEALADVLRGADLGIGSLALSRIGLRQASPLKSREYFAYGLPVLTCYEDPDLADRDALALQLSDQPWNAFQAAARCREFAEAMAPHTRGQVRDWAEARMSASLKEAQRAEFLRRVLSARA